MKTPITIRVETELLTQARRCAQEENRTLPNFIETVLRHRISEMTAASPQPGRRACAKTANGLTNAA